LDLVDLAFAVFLATGLQYEQLSVSRESLQLGQQLSHGHSLSVADSAR
jgi:hypothetical protein